VTDSEVKRCSLSAYWLMRTTERSDLTGFRGFPPGLTRPVRGVTAARRGAP
jgi:hypothetical protein